VPPLESCETKLEGSRRLTENGAAGELECW
jgi:hypothetical protein